MAGSNASPKPAETKLAKTRRHQRKPEYVSVTAMNYRKTEMDVAKLIDCLTEWRRELRTARSAAQEVAPRRSRSPSRARRMVSTLSLTPSYPRGNPLTESMEFTDGDGRGWLAYIEGARRDPPTPKRRGTTVLPDRYLRFDSATESRFTSLLPAGSPFLAEARLQALLHEAQPGLLSAPTNGSPAAASFRLGHRVIDWSTRALESGRDAIADWSRRWEEAASRREALRCHVLELWSGAANRLHGIVGVLLGHRPIRL
jgi:hypothetical protein